MSETIDAFIKEKRESFLHKYTPEHIETMSDKGEYVLGLGPSNKSFCYCVEVELKSLGEIRGSPTLKFGLWYGACRGDKEKNIAQPRNASVAT